MPNGISHFQVEQCLDLSCDSTEIIFDDNDWETSIHWQDLNEDNSENLSN